MCIFYIVNNALLVYNDYRGDVSMTKFNTRLRELRKSKALSQQNLADIVGMSKSTINMYERGDREPGLEMLETLADFFNVDLDYLLGKTDVPRLNALDAAPNAQINNYTKSAAAPKDKTNKGDPFIAAAPYSPKEAREVLVLMGYRYLDDTDKNLSLIHI